MSVSIGLLLPSREARVAGSDDPGVLLELAQLAEELGFDSVWVGDSPFARPRLDPLALLAAVAARTRRVALGTAVLLGALRPPVLAAHALASLDRIAAGRLIVGLGAGFPYPATQAEFAAAGVPFDQRVGRLMEAVRIWRALWQAPDGEPVSLSGRYGEVRDVEVRPGPVQPGGPSLWLAGSAPAALVRAGAWFDGWLPYPPTAQEYARQLQTVRAAADGRAVTPALYATVALGEDGERGLQDYCRAYYGLALEGMRQLQALHGGAVGDCAAWLAGYVAAGARHLVLRLGTLEGHARILEASGAELLAAVREAA